MHDISPIAIPPQDGMERYGFTACEGGVCAALGIEAAGVYAGFRRNPNRLDLALVAAEKPCVCAATFTTNRFCAAPVQVSRPRAAAGRARAVILNSGNANAATGNAGVEVALASSVLVAEALGCAPDEVLVASTGVIGVPLPLEPYKSGVTAAVAALARTPEAAHNAATAVMTTDTRAKEASVAGTIATGADDDPIAVHVGGFVKGSGMIQPDMATMLCVVTTDAPLTPEAAHTALLAAVKTTFNHVTVDSDTSTNDSAFLLATGAAGGEEIDGDSPAYPAVAAAIHGVCETLARMIAADGEGATKLVTVDVVGAPTASDADAVAFSIANSPLVKCALFGRDANWGRIAAAAGKSGVDFDQYACDIDLMGVPVLRGGLPLPMDEDEMLRRFGDPEIAIAISLGAGDACSRVWTCDLTHDYVTINGDYRT